MKGKGRLLRMLLPLLAALALHKPITVAGPTWSSDFLDPKPPRLVPGRTYENPHFEETDRAGHLLSDQARDVSLEVVAARAVIVTIRPVPFSKILPVHSDDDVGALPPAPTKCRTRCFSVPPRLWRRVFHQDRADTSSNWTVRLNLDSLSRAWGGPFLEVSYKAPPRDFTPRVDTSWCDSLRHIEHFLVGNLGILLEKHDDDSGTVAALDLSRAQPWAGVEILALSSNGTILGRARTDSSGFARLPLTKAKRLVARTKSEQAWLVISSNPSSWGSLGLNGADGGPKSGAAPAPRLHPFMAKQVHRPGEEVVANCLVRVPGKSRAPGTVIAWVKNCRMPDSVSLEIPAEGIVQWRFHPPAGKHHSTCRGLVVWTYQGRSANSRFSVEEPWRERGDTVNPRGLSPYDPPTPIWSPDSIASLSLLREGDTLSWERSSKREGISLVQVLQGDRVLRQFWQPLQAGTNRLRIAVDSSWDPHVLVVWTEIGKRLANDTGWRPSRQAREFRVERRLRELPLSLEAVVLSDGSAMRLRLKNPSSLAGTASLWVLDTGTSGLDSAQPDRLPIFQHMPDIVSQSWYDGLGETRQPYFRWTGFECDLNQGKNQSGSGSCDCTGGTRTGRLLQGGRGYGYASSRTSIVSVRPVSAPFSWVSAPISFGPGDLDLVVPLNGHRGPWVAGVVGASGDIFGRARIAIPGIGDMLGRLPLP